jgi:hypothetical protein
MLISSRFPVFVEEAFIPGYRTAKPLLHLVDTTVEIEEAHSEQAPVAVSARRITAGRISPPVAVRHRDGSFYRETGMCLEALRDRLERSKFIDIGPFGRSLRKQLGGIGKVPRNMKPEGIVEALTDRASGNRLPLELEEIDWSGVVVSRRDEARLDAAEAEFREAASEFVAIDGAVWVRCPEPMIRVDVKDRPGCLSLVTPPMEPGSREFAEYDERDAGYVTFTVGMQADARKVARMCFDSAMPWKEREFILDVPLPEVFSPEVPQGDIVRHLMACAVEPRLPSNIRKRVAAFLSDCSPYSADDLRREVEYLLENVPDNVRWTVRGLEFQQHRYDSEPISLDVVPPKAKFGI